MLVPDNYGTSVFFNKSVLFVSVWVVRNIYSSRESNGIIRWQSIINKDNVALDVYVFISTDLSVYFVRYLLKKNLFLSIRVQF